MAASGPPRRRLVDAIWKTERSLAYRVRLAACNPQRALVALVTESNKLILERTSWKKAWEAAELERRCTAVAWHADGACLALAFDNGLVQLFDVETGNVMHTLQSACGESPIVHLCWDHIRTAEPAPDDYPSDTLAPALPSFSECDEPAGHNGGIRVAQSHTAADLPNVAWARAVYDATPTYLLTIAHASGAVSVAANGLTHVLRLAAPAGRLGDALAVRTRVAQGAHCFGLACGDEIGLAQLPERFTNMFAGGRMWHMCKRRAVVHEVCVYVSAVLQRLRDRFEDILNEIDLKFSEYAKNKFMLDGGTVGDDLLVLLVLGTPSAELDEFLMHTLGEQRLKKAAAFLDDVYARIADLLDRNMQAAASALVFHAELLRHEMAQCALDADVCDELIAVAGSCCLKSAEMCSAVRVARTQLHVFFRWLHRWSLVLANETVPNDLKEAASQATGERLPDLVKFIKETFMKPYVEPADGSSGNEPLFNLECAGQYLGPEGKPLGKVMDVSGNWWTEIREKLLAIGDCPLLFDPRPADSLTTVLADLRAAVAGVDAEIVRGVGEPGWHTGKLHRMDFMASDLEMAPHFDKDGVEVMRVVAFGLAHVPPTSVCHKLLVADYPLAMSSGAAALRPTFSTAVDLGVPTLSATMNMGAFVDVHCVQMCGGGGDVLALATCHDGGAAVGRITLSDGGEQEVTFTSVNNADDDEYAGNDVMEQDRSADFVNSAYTEMTVAQSRDDKKPILVALWGDNKTRVRLIEVNL